MTAFEFTFSLFGLLLGFSLVEVLGGLVRTLKARRRVRVGWLTPLLGLFVMLDLTSFWMTSWDQREAIPVHYGALVFGLLITGIYYYAASMVFPERPEECEQLDDYFLAHKRQVLIAVMVSNLLSLFAYVALLGIPSGVLAVMLGLYFSFLAAAILLPGRWASGSALALLIGLYGFSAAAALVLVPVPTAPPPRAAEEVALRKAKLEEWPGFYRRQDADGLSHFLLPGFQTISDDGSIEERENILSWVRVNAWNPPNFRYEIDHIRFLSDDSALVIGRGGSDSTRDGRPCRARYRSSNLFRKVDGRWRAALSHISGEACE